MQPHTKRHAELEWNASFDRVRIIVGCEAVTYQVTDWAMAKRHARVRVHVRISCRGNSSAKQCSRSIGGAAKRMRSSAFRGLTSG